MARHGSRDEYEHLRGIIRELQKENKQLKKELRQYVKRENLYENNREEIQEVLHEKTKKHVKKLKCPECGKGTLKEFDIMNRFFVSCETCGFRKKL